jgi:hypothetical protein
MAKDKAQDGHRPLNEGYQPQNNRGYQPQNSQTQNVTPPQGGTGEVSGPNTSNSSSNKK